MREPINVIDRFVVEEVPQKLVVRTKSNGYTSPYAAKSFKKMRPNSTIPTGMKCIKSTTSLRKPKTMVSPIPKAVRTRKNIPIA